MEIIILQLLLQTGLESQLRAIIDGVVGVMLILGILGGIAGIAIYLAVGFFEMQLFTNLLATSGGRKIIHALQAFIFIPIVIGILFLLNSFAEQGLLGSTEPGSFAWMIMQVWKWILQKLMGIFTGTIAGGGTL